MIYSTENLYTYISQHSLHLWLACCYQPAPYCWPKLHPGGRVVTSQRTARWCRRLTGTLQIQGILSFSTLTKTNRRGRQRWKSQNRNIVAFSLLCSAQWQGADPCRRRAWRHTLSSSCEPRLMLDNNLFVNGVCY